MKEHCYSEQVTPVTDKPCDTALYLSCYNHDQWLLLRQSTVIQLYKKIWVNY